MPEGVLFKGGIKFEELATGDIDIVQPHHRFIVAWPSIHPNSQRYRWFGPDGAMLPEGEVPRVEDLPELPQDWLVALSKDAVREEVFDGSAPNRTRAQRDGINEELYEKLIALDDKRAPELLVADRLEKAISELTSGTGSRYDTTRDHVAALMRFHAMGRVGVPRALEQLYCAYVMEVTDTRPQEVAESEFLRFTQGAALLIAATMPNHEQHNGTRGEANGGNASQSDQAEAGPSWERVNLAGLLAGDCEPLLPTLFERTDGVCLLYPGMVHSIHGESESGKSLIMQAECVRLLNRHEDVLYLDFDSDAVSVVGRLVELGADSQLIDKHFDYRQPEMKPDSPHEHRAWAEMLSGRSALAVIDGVTDALGVFGYSTKDNDDVARWIRDVPKLIAARTGAAVVLIDHVTKDAGNRGRFAIGGQAKMAGLTGAAYTAEVIAPLGRGLRGEVVLRIGKDRPGAVRAHCGSFRKDRTQEAARIVIDSPVDRPTLTIGAPGARAGDEDSGGQNAFRPTRLMERASREIEEHPGELTKNKVAEKAGGKKQSTLVAIDTLRNEGYVTTKRGRSGHDVYESVNPYRETDDPQSDRYSNPGNVFTPE